MSRNFNQHWEDKTLTIWENPRLITAVVRLQKRASYRTHDPNGSHSLAIAPIALCGPTAIWLLPCGKKIFKSENAQKNETQIKDMNLRDTAHTCLMKASSAETVPSGERDPCVWPWVRATLGKEGNTLGVRVCCSVYVYSSDGRRSEADRTRYEQKIERKKETHKPVLVLL